MVSYESSGNNANLWAGIIPETAEEIAYLESYLTPERLNKLDSVLQSRRKDIIPVMYSLYDPYNIAGILRTAEAFGLQEVHIIDEVKHHRYAKCVTKGCEKWLSLYHHKTFDSCATELKCRGYHLLVADMDGTPLDNLHITDPVALIVGSEHDGVPAKIRQQADQIVSIPMCGFSQSMNVSVSMASLLTTLLAQRGFNNSTTLPNDELDLLRRKWLIKAVPHAESLLRHFREQHTAI